MASTRSNARRWLIALGALWVIFLGAVVVVMIARGDGPFGIGQDETDADDTVAVSLVSPAGGDGWFTTTQASRGGDEYAQHCAQCHGDGLEGGVGPALAGDTFWERWEGDTVHTLFEVTRQTMPQDAPGSLSNESYVDVTAHVLQANDLPAGDTELPPEEEQLRALTLERGAADAVEADAPEAPTEPDEEPAISEESEPTEEPDDTEEPTEPDDTHEAAAPDEPDQPIDVTEREATPDDEAWFSAAQVQAGSTAFSSHCAACHGADLQGSPPLVGGGFPERYDTVWELYQYVRQTMPQDDPGSLDDETYLHTVAYVLDANGYPTGEHRVEAGRARLEDLRLDSDLAGEPVAEADDDDPTEVEADEPADPAEASDDASDDATNGDADEAWFSEEQAERGGDAYAQHCAQCHGDDLQGDPPLTADALHASFDTVWDLFDYTRTQMPQGDPGSLDDDTYADVVAHVLGQNEYPAGDDELEADEQAMQDMPLEEDRAEADAEAEDPEAEPAEADAEAEDPEAEPTEADAAEAEGPGRGRAWLDIETQPANVTINLVGPGGFVGRATGGQQLRDLVPGVYVVAASRGHESAMATVTLRSGETERLTLVLDELSRSGDVPEEPAVPMTEVPAIPREPADRVRIGNGAADREDPGDAPDDRDDDADAAEDAGPVSDEDAPEAAGVTTAEPRDASPARDPEDQLQAERGERAYALHCARCHGANLAGDVAPALAGEVFFERWAGHPVDWLYFQARAAMPPHGPGFLSEQAYADIIVYALRESDVLDGHEDFRPHDEAFRMLTITPRAAVDGRPELDAQVERLRQAIQAPHADAILGVAGPLMPVEWPDDLGTAPIGPPGRIDAAAAVETDGAEGDDEQNGDAEQEEPAETDDDTDADDDGGAHRPAPAATPGA